MKAHIGVDADSGLLHGDERVVLGDRAYTGNGRNLEAERQESEPVWAMPFKRKKGEELQAEHVKMQIATSGYSTDQFETKAAATVRDHWRFPDLVPDCPSVRIATESRLVHKIQTGTVFLGFSNS